MHFTHEDDKELIGVIDSLFLLIEMFIASTINQKIYNYLIKGISD